MSNPLGIGSSMKRLANHNFLKKQSSLEKYSKLTGNLQRLESDSSIATPLGPVNHCFSTPLCGCLASLCTIHLPLWSVSILSVAEPDESRLHPLRPLSLNSQRGSARISFLEPQCISVLGTVTLLSRVMYSRPSQLWQGFFPMAVFCQI